MGLHAEDKFQQEAQFDTDLAPIGVNNHCTGCIFHSAEDFISPLEDYDRPIKGFGGTRGMNVKRGTLVWDWLDDQGKRNRFIISKAFYVPDDNVWLLSPQYWAQT